MNIGIIGAGSIVPAFLDAAGQVEGMNVTAIAGRESSRVRMEAYAAKYHIEKQYYDYKKLLQDEEIDVVYIALPNDLHYSYGMESLKAKKHVILEKPFTTNRDEAMGLISYAKDHGLYIFEAITNQFFPNYDKTRELLKELGEIKIVQMNFSQYSRRYEQFKQGTILPVFDAAKAGGALMDINVYNIHFIMGLFGAPEKVSYIANVSRGVDTSGILTLSYPGFQAVAIGAKDCKAPASITIQGDQGCIVSDSTPNKYVTFSHVTNEGCETKYALGNFNDRMCYELEAFREIMENDAREEWTRLSSHTMQVMLVLDQAREQIGMAGIPTTKHSAFIKI